MKCDKLLINYYFITFHLNVQSVSSPKIFLHINITNIINNSVIDPIAIIGLNIIIITPTILYQIVS